MPLEAPWKNGKVETAGGVCLVELNGIQDVTAAPNQWVLGTQQIRLPGSLLLEPEAERLEVLEAAEDPNSAMARSLGIREAARVAQVRMDTDSRVRRALLPQSTPTRGPFPVGSCVYFYRQQAPPGTGRVYKWHGPARVIGLELRNQRRLEDQDLPTEGGQPHSCWLRHGNSVVLVTGEQLRFASEVSSTGDSCSTLRSWRSRLCGLTCSTSCCSSC